MDSKRLVIGTTLAMALFVGWYFLLTWINKTYAPLADNSSTTTNTAQTAAAPTTGPAAGTQPTTGATVATQQPAGLRLLASSPSTAPASASPLGSAVFDDKQFALQLRTTAAGAGVDSVVLNKFLRTVDDPKKEPYVFQQGDPAVVEQYGHALATRSVTVNGTPIDVSKANWTLERQDATSATYAITIGDGERPVLKVLKTYRVYPRDSKEHPGLGYEVRLDYDFENHGDKPVTVSVAYNGPAMPPRELDAGPDQRVISGYRKGLNIAVDNHYVETFRKDEVVRDLAVSSDKVPMNWAGGSSVYFQALVMPPVTDNGSGAVASTTRSFKGIGLNPDAHEKQPLALTGETIDLTVRPHERYNYPFYVFFGPKWREVLDTPFYASLPRDYNQTLVVRVGPCSICAFDPVINFLVWLLGVFHLVWGGFAGRGDWGLAIISLVILVRLTLHPITKRSQISMMKMGKMGPEMKRLQEKFKDDKEGLQRAMWEFQKQQGVTPILGCLPMFLQMPIWIALWSALNTTFELRHASFLWGWTWIHDLAKPDRLIRFPADWAFKIPILGTHVDAINLLPVLLAVVFYLQQKYNPKPATMTPEQAQQQKIMQGMMVFLFPLFLYAQPSGLNLYIMTSTAIGIWESKRIRQHIKEKEEAEKAGVVIVDAPPPTTSGPGVKRRKDEPIGKARGGGKEQKPAPTNWFARKLAELQEKAEQAKRQAERRGRDRA